jgi:hypothetical protein
VETTIKWRSRHIMIVFAIRHFMGVEIPARRKSIFPTLIYDLIQILPDSSSIFQRVSDSGHRPEKRQGFR